MWFAVDRDKRQHLDFVVGTRGTETGIKLWKKIEPIADERIMTDYWKSYAEMIPENKLKQSKKETYTVESYNGLLRHYLARFRRKTKCYTKSLEMLEISVSLFIAKRNNTLSIYGY